MYRNHMERYYNIAGIYICISGKDDEMQLDNCHLNVFETEKTENAYRYEYHLVKKLPEPIGNCIYKEASYMLYQDGEKQVRYIGGMTQGISGAYMSVETCGKHVRVEVLEKQVQGKIGRKVILNSLGIEHLAALSMGIVFHASYIVRNGKGILFTAPSGTGKSTQAELWRTFRGTEIINGDRVCIKYEENQFWSCGIPFAGSSKYCKNVTVPIEAIVYLHQAPKTKVERLEGKEAFLKILEGASMIPWDRNDTEILLNIIQKMIQEVPIYQLFCTPDESAVIAVENELGKEW